MSEKSIKNPSTSDNTFAPILIDYHTLPVQDWVVYLFKEMWWIYIFLTH